MHHSNTRNGRVLCCMHVNCEHGQSVFFSIHSFHPLAPALSDSANAPLHWSPADRPFITRGCSTIQAKHDINDDMPQHCENLAGQRQAGQRDNVAGSRQAIQQQHAGACRLQARHVAKPVHHRARAEAVDVLLILLRRLLPAPAGSRSARAAASHACRVAEPAYQCVCSVNLTCLLTCFAACCLR